MAAVRCVEWIVNTLSQSLLEPLTQAIAPILNPPQNAKTHLSHAARKPHLPAVFLAGAFVTPFTMASTATYEMIYLGLSLSEVKSVVTEKNGVITKEAAESLEAEFARCESARTKTSESCDHYADNSTFSFAGGRVNKTIIELTPEGSVVALQYVVHGEDTDTVMRTMPKELGDWSEFEITREMVGDARKRLACVAKYVWYTDNGRKILLTVSQSPVAEPVAHISISEGA